MNFEQYTQPQEEAKQQTPPPKAKEIYQKLTKDEQEFAAGLRSQNISEQQIRQTIRALREKEKERN